MIVLARRFDGDSPFEWLVVLVGLGIFLWVFGGRWVRRQQRRAQSDAVSARAAAVAQDDPAFDPATVLSRARRVFETAMHGIDRGDRERLRSIASPTLAARWFARMDDLERQGFRQRILLHEPVEVDLLGFRDEHGHDDDRVTVFVTCPAVEDFLESPGGGEANRRPGDFRGQETTRIEERWTLGRRDGEWIAVGAEPAEHDRSLSLAGHWAMMRG